MKVIYNNKLKRTIVSLTIYTSFNINVDYMQVILNYLAFLLIFFSLQIFLFRFLRININKPSIIFFFIIISVIIGFYSFSIELVLNLIIINLTIICFYTLVPAIINYGPGLEIIDLIANKKINKKNILKKYFLKGKVSKSVEKRLQINISSNLIKLDKGKFVLTKNTKNMLIILRIIKKFYRLKSDAY